MKLKTRLLDYQERAVGKLCGVKVGALYMEQGTGKTRTALELIHRRYLADKIDHILWLCPCNALPDIRDNISYHAEIEPGLLTMCGIETLSSSARANSGLLTLTAEKRCYLIVDESLLVKNPYALRSQAIIRLSQQCIYKLILNGTPISRTEADLFAQWYILDWRILGYRSYWSFAANHLEYDEHTNRIVRTLNTEYLMSKIEPYTFQLSKSECLSLPTKTYKTHYFRITDEQEAHYDEIADQMLFQLDELKPETLYRLFSALQAITSGKRIIVSGNRFRTSPFFACSQDNPRTQALLEILPTEKAIIFCKYTNEIHELCTILNERLGEGCALPFDGSLSKRARQDNLKQFQGGATYLIANRGCAGYGLNLQFCRHIVYYSNDWDLATRIQSEDRVHRIGQSQKVIVQDLCAANTIDERISSCLTRKENLLHLMKSLLRRQNKTQEWVRPQRSDPDEKIIP